MIVLLAACVSLSNEDLDGDGYTLAAGDCDDLDVGVHPGALDRVGGADSNCDGADGVDADQDSAASTWSGGTDCDDANAAVRPGAQEVCNGHDDDCDGTADGADAVDAATWFEDRDGDGHGSDVSARSCRAILGYAAAGDDCDDARAATHPGAVEYCNLSDDDCDGDVDEGAADVGTYYEDGDLDGFGGADRPVEACQSGEGRVTNTDDCDDDDATVFPGAEEVCNDGVRNDCSSSSPDCRFDGSYSEFDAAGTLTSADGLVPAVSGSLRDLDGDGVSDFAAAVDSYDVDQPAVVIVSGPVVGEVDAATATVLSGRPAEMLGPPELLAGTDLDGDGVAEIVLTYDWDPELHELSGLYVFAGPFVTDRPIADADVALLGNATEGFYGDWFGSLASADFDGDGRDDLATTLLSTTSSVAVFLGPLLPELSFDDAFVRFDTTSDRALAARGDLTGDGSPDLVEADGFQGIGHVLEGAEIGSASLEDAAVTFTYPGRCREYTTSTSTGDITGDGWVDLLVGTACDESGGEDAGAVSVVAGPLTGSLELPTVGYTLSGSSYDALGAAVNVAGDLDGDGADDLLVSAPSVRPNGLVYLVYGGADLGGGTVAAAAAAQFSFDDALSAYPGIQGMGDVDANGLDDFAISHGAVSLFWSDSL